MIKTINWISFLLLLAISVLALFTYHQDMDVQIPSIETIFIVLAVFSGLLLCLKINLRWQAILIGAKQEGYPISKSGFTNTIVYEGINLVFYFLIGTTFLLYVHEIWFLGLVLFLHFLEGVVHLIVNKLYTPYKIIVNNNSIMIITHSVKIIKWNKVKKIESKHNDIHFVDTNNQTALLDLDLISKHNAEAVKLKIKEIAATKHLYCGV